jgi:hypothetical protein
MEFGAVSATIHCRAQGRALEEPRDLEPEASYGLLQVSLPHPRGGLQRCHMFIMTRLVCNYVHRIVLQFFPAFAYSPLMWSVTFSLSHL